MSSNNEKPRCFTPVGQPVTGVCQKPTKHCLKLNASAGCAHFNKLKHARQTEMYTQDPRRMP